MLDCWIDVGGRQSFAAVLIDSLACGRKGGWNSGMLDCWIDVGGRQSFAAVLIDSLACGRKGLRPSTPERCAPV